MEAIINTHPFTYVYGDFLSGFTLTPAHFLTANLDTVIPFNIDDCEDVDYQQKRDSAQELTEILEEEWDMCLRIVLVLRRRYAVTVVEKDIIIDACVHRSFQDRKQMPYWSWNQVNHLLSIMLSPTSSADESIGL